jgi:hypothetical protein
VSLEPVKFRCDHCKEVSSGMLDFTYYDEVIHTRKWIMKKEYEMTDGAAKCEHCGLVSDVWPKIHVEKVWTPRK